MKFLIKLKEIIRKSLFNSKWRCNICNKEIFTGEYFCDDCKKKLPFNDGIICNHCGRKLIASENYCSTCKGVIVSVDKSRSSFNYEKPISTLIKKAKYNGGQYILEIFAIYLSNTYFKNYFDADFLTYVPMTKKSFNKRGYNQSKILAEKLSLIIGVPILGVLSKTKDTIRQAKLNRKDRLNNLINAFSVTDKKAVKNKKIMIIDDVSTTGATSEAMAIKLKKAGAMAVYLLTVASVPPREKY